MQSTNNVHIKIQCENEFRRFVLSEVTYYNLSDMIRTLLGFAPETTFKLSYLDDESDWVLFTTDSELSYAVALSKSPLKISVKLCTPVPATTAVPVQSLTLARVGDCEVPTHDCEVEDEKPWRCRRGGRGGARGGRGGWKKNPAVVGERIDAKLARLNERHAVLTAKLIEGDLPEDKTRGIEWRLSHLQNKIDNLKLKKEQLSDASAVKKEETHPAGTEPAQVDETRFETESLPTEAASEDTHFCGRRRGGRGGRGAGRGCWKREREYHHLHQDEEGEEKCCRGKKVGGPIAFACSTPEGKAAHDRLVAAKEAVLTARREKAGKEVVMQKIEELKEAKANWKEVKIALWQEKRAAAGAPCTVELK